MQKHVQSYMDLKSLEKIFTTIINSNFMPIHAKSMDSDAIVSILPQLQ